MMIVICAWCKTYLKSEPGPAQISHGICARCKQKLLEPTEGQTTEESPYDPHLIEISLPSELGYEKVATSAITTLARPLGFSQERLDDLKTALSEAVLNAIEHGNGLNSQRRVQIIALAEDNALTLKIIDEGLQPLPSLNLARQERMDHRGWGLFLIKSLVDEVKAVVTPGRNELQLKLHVTSCVNRGKDRPPVMTEKTTQRTSVPKTHSTAPLGLAVSVLAEEVI